MLRLSSYAYGSSRPYWWRCSNCAFAFRASPAARRARFPGGCPHCAGRAGLVKRYQREAEERRRELDLPAGEQEVT
ncbi:MAG: zinc-ribbon domain-containing protein [Gemmatimonadota bacterium]